MAPGDTPTKFMEQLEAKTGVPVARQKLMAKGAWRGVLKAEMSLEAQEHAVRAVEPFFAVVPCSPRLHPSHLSQALVVPGVDAYWPLAHS